METTAFIFALAGISFGLMGFLASSTNTAKIKELTTKIEELQKQIEGE